MNGQRDISSFASFFVRLVMYKYIKEIGLKMLKILCKEMYKMIVTKLTI